MNRYTLFAFFAILLALATSANAQDCSTAITGPTSYAQTPPDPLAPGTLKT